MSLVQIFSVWYYSNVRSDKCQQHILGSLQWLKVQIIYSVGFLMLLCSVNKAVRSSDGGGGGGDCVTLRDRPEGINHGCQPLTLSVWSLGHTWAWWSLPGNELQEAASIIHTYKSVVCPLFWEMRLNEGWPYLGSVLLIRRHVTLFCLCFQTPAASYRATCFHGTYHLPWA